MNLWRNLSFLSKHKTRRLLIASHPYITLSAYGSGQSIIASHPYITLSAYGSGQSIKYLVCSFFCLLFSIPQPFIFPDDLILPWYAETAERWTTAGLDSSSTLTTALTDSSAGTSNGAVTGSGAVTSSGGVALWVGLCGEENDLVAVCNDWGSCNNFNSSLDAFNQCLDIYRIFCMSVRPLLSCNLSIN